MSFYLGLVQLIGIHTLLGLSAYVLMLTGQLSLGQAGFFAIGAYSAGILTVIFELPILPALIVAAIIAAVLRISRRLSRPACQGTDARGRDDRFRRIRSPVLLQSELAGCHAATSLSVPTAPTDSEKSGISSPTGGRHGRITAFVWIFVVLVMAALWWADRSRAGAVLRAVGEDELAAQSVGINLTAVKVAAMTAGGFVAGIGGALYAHTTTYVDHLTFTVLLATFAISYPILGGLSSVFGTLLAVIFIQGILVEGLRFLGDWRSIVFGLLIIVAMNLKPSGLFDPRTARILRRAVGLGRRE